VAMANTVRRKSVRLKVLPLLALIARVHTYQHPTNASWLLGTKWPYRWLLRKTSRLRKLRGRLAFHSPTPLPSLKTLGLTIRISLIFLNDNSPRPLSNRLVIHSPTQIDSLFSPTCLQTSRAFLVGHFPLLRPFLPGLKCIQLDGHLVLARHLDVPLALRTRGGSILCILMEEVLSMEKMVLHLGPDKLSGGFPLTVPSGFFSHSLLTRVRRPYDYG